MRSRRRPECLWNEYGNALERVRNAFWNAFWNPFETRFRTHSESVLDSLTSKQYSTFEQNMPNIDIEVNLVNEDYWNLRPRESVKRRLTNCFVCKGIDGKLFKTQKLPQSRPNYASEKLPVNNTGIYFASPLYVKRMNQLGVSCIPLFLLALPR